MDIQYNIYLGLAPLTAVLTFITAAYSWQSRRSARARMLTAFMLLICGWLIANTLELVSKTETLTVFWAQVTYIFFNGGMIAWFLFATCYADLHFSKWYAHLLISLIPIVNIVLVFTNASHHLIWQSYTFHQGSMYLFMQVKYGPWFWVQAAYLYSLTIAGAFIIFAKYFQSFHIFRQRSKIIVIGVTLPLLANLIYISKIIPTFQKDYSAISFALAGVFFAWGVYRSRTFELSPVALNTVIDQIGDGLLVIDQQERVIAANPAFLQIVGKTETEIFCQPIEMVLHNWSKILDGFKNNPSQPYEFKLYTDQGIQHHFECKISTLSEEKKSQSAGQVITLHEITDRVKLLNAVQELATTDPLTNISNRRQFFELAEKEYSRAIRYQRDLSLVIMDIDRFKTVNDNFGHLVGDQALKGLANLCKQNLRMADLFARYGGEEFVILMPETSPQEAEMAVERLRQKIARHPITADIEAVAITVSIGIAHLTGETNLSLDNLLDRADKALYSAKMSGRNRIATWSEDKQETVRISHRYPQ